MDKITEELFENRQKLSEEQKKVYTDHLLIHSKFIPSSVEKYNIVFDQNKEFSTKTAMKERGQSALKFLQNSSDESLKEWLADQYVPHIMWKNASHEELIALVLTTYDD